MNIRAFRDSDYERARGLLVMVQAFHASQRPDIYKPPWHFIPRAHYRESLHRTEELSAVAEEGGVLAGICLVSLEECAPGHTVLAPRRYASVEALCVSPDFRRQGVAEGLMRYVKARAEALGLDGLDLGVSAFNFPAKALYEKLGFTVRSYKMEWKTGKGDKGMTIYDELKARGLIAQVTDEEEIKELINSGKATFYIGFDPTADSLHVGHFMALCLMKRLQMAGNRPIALIGGGTGYIGDPSGRSDMRGVMTPETIQHNCDRFKEQMEKFIDFGEGKAMMLNNADWLLELNYVELLREVGACFSVNNMLRAECYKQRMEKGLSFLEFNYMIMQSYDFYHMYQSVGCNMQCGGDDQWSNMLGGTELIRRKLGKNAYAMTITLLMTSEGKKMGKTQAGAVWLDPEKTSPYDFYQYWRNIDDADVLKCLRMLTFLPLEQIDEMDHWEGSHLNTAKKILAFELTKLIHGEEETQKAQNAAKALFVGGGDDANMPTTILTGADLTDGAITILDLLVKCGLAPSKAEARRLVQQGGVEANGVKQDSFTASFNASDLCGNGLTLKKGKKVFHKATME